MGGIRSVSQGLSLIAIDTSSFQWSFARWGQPPIDLSSEFFYSVLLLIGCEGHCMSASDRRRICQVWLKEANMIVDDLARRGLSRLILAIAASAVMGAGVGIGGV